MITSTRSMKWTALAVASAIFIAPVAYSGGKISTFAKKTAPTAASKKVAEERYDRFIVSYRGGATKLTASAQKASFDKASKASGLGIAKLRTLGTGAALIRTSRKLDKAASKQLAVELMKDPTVLAVEVDRKLKPTFVPNDPQYAQQWHYKNGPGGINVEPAWDIGTGEGVVVAVIDTGITDHSDLDANVLPGYDFVSGDSDGTFFTAADGDGRDADAHDPGDWDDGTCDFFGQPSDSSWHGTHVAGTIAAATNNAKGVAGIAYGAKVEPVRALGRCGGYISDINDAVTWASGGTVDGVPANPNPAEVINLSLGGSGACSVAEQTAYSAAIARGSVVVVAAGNSASDAASFSPASCDGVIAVAAVGPTGELAGYSNYGAKVSVAAPGGSGVVPAEDNVLSTVNLGLKAPGQEGYAWYAGTSMASPHVAAIAALMQSVAPTPLTPAQVKKIIENTAYASNGTVPGCNVDKPCGTGYADARQAVAVANGDEPIPADPPPPPPPPPGIPLVNGGTVTGIEIEEGGDIVYQIDVPNASRHLLFAISGGTGDVDMYVRKGNRPSNSVYDCRPFKFGNEESCYFSKPAGGTWYVRLNGYEAATDVELYASFIDSGYPYALNVTKVRSRTELTWKGGKATVDLYRNRALWKTIANTGAATDTKLFSGGTPTAYKVCNAGTTECSDEAKAGSNSR